MLLLRSMVKSRKFVQCWLVIAVIFSPRLSNTGGEFFPFLITKSPRSGVNYSQAVISTESHVFSKTILQGVEYKQTDEFACFSSVVASHGHIKSVVSVALGPCTVLVEQEGLTGVFERIPM